MEEETKKVEKKNSKKGIIITIIILAILALAVVAGYFTYQYIESNKTVGTQWGDTYYKYLEEAKQSEEDVRNSNFGISNNMENTTIQFTETIENKEPQMIMNYEKENQNYVTIYYINEENNVDFVKNETPATVELLYNIEKEEYIWYLHTKESENEKYTPVENIVNSESKEQEYTFTKDELISTDEKISKFDETFIVPENVESKKVEFNIDSSKEELKELIEKTVEEYETKEQIVTEEVKKDIQDKKTKLDTKKEEIKKAEEERIKQEEEAKRLAEEEAKKAEEAAKKAEEEAAKKAAAEQNKTTTTNSSSNQSMKAGNYTLNYGTYKGTTYMYTGDPSTEMDITIVLNKNNTYTKTTVLKSTGKKESKSGTFSIGTFSNMGKIYDGKPCVKFDGNYTFMIPKNNTLEEIAGAGSRYTYQGN